MALLGPNGRPISSSHFTKEKPPKLGPSFGNWSGRDVEYLTLPGGGLVQFDLSRLRLSDYRVMRDHYQVNASLSVLMFMVHQADWRIECEDKKVRDLCTYNLDRIWTRLIRSLSQAFWAGYSPNVLEWENEDRRVIVSKVKDLIPEQCEVKWKEIEGWAPPHGSGNKQKIYDGIKQHGTRWDIPVENCVHPDTKILCADLVWRRAGELRVGDKIVAVDEEDRGERGGRGGRQYCEATIVVNNAMRKCSVAVNIDGHDPIVCSEDHPFLVRVSGDRGAVDYKETFSGSCLQCGKTVIQSNLGRTRYYCDETCAGRYRTAKRRGQGINVAEHWKWVNAVDLKPGAKIAWFADPWEYDGSREAGWLAGVFDGEGCLSNGQLTISQNPGVVSDAIKNELGRLGFIFDFRQNRDAGQFTIQGGMREIMRFMALIRPMRLSPKFGWEGVWLKIGKSVDLATVREVIAIGEQPISSIQTSSGTFITGGAITHNSLWYPILMENGNYWGRKLLRPAYTSWFFSILVHLFSNRYFERFGEPVPVGRAPFDDEVSFEGQTIKGNELMLTVLEQLRNRSVVVLPNSRSSHNDGQSYEDYSIQYLESQMRGADFERYLTRLDEEISLALFTPLLLLRTSDVGSYNLGIEHMKVYLWMLNALMQDIREYVERYLLYPLTNYNFGKNADRPRLEFRKLGKENVETVRAILAEMTKNGQVKPNFDELSQITGMTLQEVKILTEDEDDDDTGSSDTDTRTGRQRGRRTEPRGTGEARATGKKVSSRISAQVTKDFRSGNWGKRKLTLGYRRRMVQALIADGFAGNAEEAVDGLYSNMTAWLSDIESISTEFDSPEEFVSMFDKVLAVEIDKFGTEHAE